MYCALGSVEKVATKLREDLMNTTKLLDEIEYYMEDDKTNNNIWLGFKEPWRSQRKQKRKYQQLIKKLLSYAIDTTSELHQCNILHLDIKGNLNICINVYFM